MTDDVDGPARGIAGIGGYVPRYRIEVEALREAWGQTGAAGVERTAVPDADEDSLTMAYEAATRALDAADVEASELGSIALATTTPPLDEEAVTARLASFLGVTDVRTAQFTGSTAAGANAFRAGLEADGGPALVVASDAPRGAPDGDFEHAAGAGAAALVLVADGPGTVGDLASRTDAYPGTRFRPTESDRTRGLGISRYDREAFVDTIAAVTGDLEYDAEAVDAAAIQSPDGALPYRASDAVGVEPDRIRAGTTVHDVGDAGAASPLLGLASAAVGGAETVLLVGYGSGAEAVATTVSVDGVPVAFERDGPTETLSYAAYLRRRGEITPGEPHGGGAYVSVPNWRRSLAQRHRLVAGRCPACGGLNLPPEGACVECAERVEYEPVTLPGTGTVEAVTTIGRGGAPPEFVAQQARSGSFASAIVALDGPDGPDDTASLPMQLVGEGEPSIGDRVTTTIRRIYTQEDLPRYGRKAVLEADS